MVLDIWILDNLNTWQFRYSDIHLPEPHYSILQLYCNGHLSKLAPKQTCTQVKIQWGSEIQPFKIQKYLKSRLFEGRISDGPVFKCLGFSYCPKHSKSGSFCPDFKWFLTKWWPLDRISNGWASRFQIPFNIRTNPNPTSLWPFEIQTNSDFRSPL